MIIIHEIAVLVVKKKLQFSSNGPPFHLDCLRPMFSPVGLDASSGYWGSLCHTGCSAGGFLQCAEQNVCLSHGSLFLFLLHETKFNALWELDAVDMQLTSNR